MYTLPLARWTLAGFLASLLCACTAENVPLAAAPRPVKVERVASDDARPVQTFIGTLRAAQRAELGFETGGRIAAINVEVGDRVRAGQVLAVLDARIAQQHLIKAEADYAAANAALGEREAQLARLQGLEREQIVAGAQVDAVRAQRDTAVGQQQVAGAALALARRELGQTEIRAPFDGQIVARLAQAYGDMAPGQAVLHIEAPGTLEAVVGLPDAVAARTRIGERARLIVDGTAYMAQLTKLSARADNGAQVAAIFRVDGASSRLRSGLAVALELPGDARRSMSLPASAVLPDAQAGDGQVFVLDSARERVELRHVRYATALNGDERITVLDGVADGEWVVVAGAPFLTDGQSATRFVAATRLAGATP